MNGLVFDIETNGLLKDLTKVHCVAFKEIGTNEPVRSFGGHTDEKVREALSHLEDAPLLVGHNIISFDLAALQKVYPTFRPRGVVRDTLVCAQLIWPDITQNDFAALRRDKNFIPGPLVGTHKLKAWGYRLGELKGAYGDDDEQAWERWSEEMEAYCRQDVRVAEKLWYKILEKKYSPEAVELEHQFARCLAIQEYIGFPFNVRAAQDLYADLAAKRSELKRSLQKTFPPIERTETFTPKVNNQKLGYQKGVPFTKRWWEDFNPNSGEELAERLSLTRGWVPEKLTATGKPQMDDEVLDALKLQGWPEIEQILDYKAVDKIIKMLAEGNSAWLKLEKNGRMHGRVKGNGTVTGRCSHSSPNMGQIPKEGELGGQCRALFFAPSGWSLVGADASGLELRALSHYLAPFDGGAYIIIVTTGDVHTENQKAAGLDSRPQSKTFI